MRKSYRSVCEYCDAEDAFKSWRKHNPYVYIGLSNKGKKLLSELIIAYDFFLKMHPIVDGESTREYLLSLFDDLPPRPYKPPPITREKSPSGDFFVFCHNQIKSLLSIISCDIIAPTYVKRKRRSQKELK